MLINDQKEEYFGDMMTIWDGMEFKIYFDFNEQLTQIITNVEKGEFRKVAFVFGFLCIFRAR